MRRQKFTPRVEELDQRDLLSVTLANGLLTIEGTTTADQIRITLPSAQTLQVTVDTTGDSQQFSLSSVSGILVRPRAGSDFVMIGPNITLHAEVRGWSGNDTILGGGGDDLLLGGGGTDSIQGRNGNDTLLGQADDDYLVGGAGNDTLDGQGGYNLLDGGAGTNTLRNGTDLGFTFDIALPGGLGSFTLTNDSPSNLLAKTFTVKAVGGPANVSADVFIDSFKLGTLTTDNSGNGQFTFHQSYDSNNDGIPDILQGVVPTFPEINSATVATVVVGNETLFVPLTAATPARTDFATGSKSIRSVATADLNGDGKLDVVAADKTSSGPDVSVFLNTTAPGATSPSLSLTSLALTGGGVRSVAIADINGDGKPDLAVAYAGINKVAILLNQTPVGATTAVFTPSTGLTTGNTPFAVALGDLNGDGKPDIAFVNDFDDTASVFLNTTTAGGTPSFSNSQTLTTGNRPQSVTITDINGDGRPDLAVVNHYDQTSGVSVFLNTGSGGFSARQDFATGFFPDMVSTGDLNNDGKADLAVANFISGTVAVLLNTTTAASAIVAFSPTLQFTTGEQSVAVAMGDFFGHGQLDLAVTNAFSNAVSVLRNTTAPGDITPAFVTTYTLDMNPASEPRAVAFGDITGDGKPELIVGSDDALSVFVNTPSPTLDFPASSFLGSNLMRSVAKGDFNGDSKPDVAVANSGSNTVSVFLNTTPTGATTPNFAAKVDFGGLPLASSLSPHAVSVDDFNGDGKPDIAIANAYSDNLAVFLNTTATGATAPNFTGPQFFPVGVRPFSLATGDINGDGHPDLIAGNTSSANLSVLLNDGTGQFRATQNVPVGNTPYGVAVADVNGDGKLDLTVSDFGQPSVTILLNTTVTGATTATFNRTDVTTKNFTFGAAVGDVDGDGKPDVVVTNYYSGSVSVLLNRTAVGATSPTFAPEQVFLVGKSPYAVAMGDLNGDGKLDLIVANQQSNSASILLNTTVPGSAASFVRQDFAVGGVAPRAVALADFNGDGLLDVTMANSASNTLSVLLNRPGR